MDENGDMRTCGAESVYTMFPPTSSSTLANPGAPQYAGLALATLIFAAFLRRRVWRAKRLSVVSRTEERVVVIGATR